MLVRGSADPIAPAAGRGRMGRRRRAALARLTPGDRHALGMWAGAHAALAIIAWLAGWISGSRSIYQNLLGTYGQWDTAWYQTIAAHGYFSGHQNPVSAAFLPGEAAAMAAMHLLVRNWILAGLTVSLIAGAVALVCLNRLGGSQTTLLILTAPAAMYLAVGYSEALFLALALPAWMAARRRDWLAVGLLTALAGLVRVNGLFLLAAVLLAAATTDRGCRRRALALTSIGFVGPAVYEVYLRAGSGSWTDYLQANRRGWGLRFVGPWQSFKNTWDRAFSPGLAPDQAAMYQVEMACMAVGVALTLVLLWRRQWPEAVYCGLTFAVLGTATFYQSVPRALLLCWPLYVLVAQGAQRRPWVRQVYVWTCAPAAVIVAVFFFAGRWGI